MGQAKKKAGWRRLKLRSDVNADHVDESEKYYRTKFDAQEDVTRDFIPLSIDQDGSDDSETDMMEAMGLSGVMGNEDDNETSYSDVEGSAEDESAHEEDVRGAWGRRAANYYEEGIEQNDEESDDNSDIELQEEEAEKLHKDALKSLLPAHCLLDESLALSCPEKVLEQPMDFEKEIEVILSGLSGAVHVNGSSDVPSGAATTAEDTRRVLQRDHPELLPLLKEMKDKATEVTDRLNPLLERCRNNQLLTHEGLSYLEMRSQLLLCYLQYLCYYMLLKLHGRSVKEHPVLDRLVELRVLITQLKPIEQRLQPQIQRLLHAETSSASLRPRPQLIGDDTSEKDDGLADLSSDEETETKQPQLYKPPKLMGVDYVDGQSSRELERKAKADARQERRLRKSEVVEALREEFQEVPVELRESSTSRLEQDALARRIMQKELAREEFEEDAMCRLQVTKTDKKERRLLREKQRSLLAGGSTLEELTNFADRAIDAHFEDPTLSFVSGKQNLHTGLSAIQGATSRMEKKRYEKNALNAADVHVGAKVIKRTKFDPTIEDHFGGGEKEVVESFSDENDGAIPDVVQEAIALKDTKKKVKAQRAYDKGMSALPDLDATVEGKRKIGYEIEKNKGLTRKRKKIEGSARAHNRLKYEKKMRLWKSVQQPLREASSSGHYGGEETGIKANLKKSVTLAA